MKAPAHVLLLAVAGCAATQPVAVTRQAAVDPAALAGRPVCFAPPPVMESLIERKAAEDRIRLCEKGAVQENTGIVPYGTPGCLVATVGWWEHGTGRLDVQCQAVMGVTCTGHEIRQKVAKVTLAEQPGGPAIAESVAALQSESSGFTEATFYALCRTAFHQYPKPLSNYQFEVPVDP